ncbi:hypothetical protein KC727_03070 [Candidatus Kaiserbacteria bacterium]|nr:hypothetical protein [Candidatus Kaiserbacteria bacterium]
MHTTEQTPRIVVIKLLTVVGFLATIGLIGWVAAQLVALAPSAFTSLANLAQTLSDEDPRNELSLTLSDPIVANGEVITATWNNLHRKGAYTFAYECADGVSLALFIDAAPYVLECDTPHTLPSDARVVDLALNSEKKRFADVHLAFSFQDAEDDAIYEQEASVTIINSSIPSNPPIDLTLQMPDPATIVPPPDPLIAGAEDSIDAVNDEGIFPVPSEFLYDLSLTYLGSGDFDNGVFSAQTQLSHSDLPALQVGVRNVGIETSLPFELIIINPDGSTVSAGTFQALRANEQETTVVSLRTPSTPGSYTLGAQVLMDDEVNTTNNSFTRVVSVVE